MARGGFSSSNYLSVSTSPTYPFTIGFWFDPTTEIMGDVFSWHYSAGGNGKINVAAGTTGVKAKQYRFAQSEAFANKTTVSGTWNFGAGIFAGGGTNDSKAYCNDTYDGTSVSPGGAADFVDRLRIGASGGGIGGTGDYIGYAALCCWWNVALTEADCDVIYRNRIAPWLYKRSNVVYAWRFNNVNASTETAHIGSLTLSETGAVPWQAQPQAPDVFELEESSILEVSADAAAPAGAMTGPIIYRNPLPGGPPIIGGVGA